MGKDTVSDKFGMREIKIVDRQFYVNDRPVYMRGTVENCTFPHRFPPTDVDSWLRVFKNVRNMA